MILGRPLLGADSGWRDSFREKDGSSVGGKATAEAAKSGDLVALLPLVSTVGLNTSIDKWGRTPTMLLAGRGHEHALRGLLALVRPDLEVEDSAGMTALAMASQYGHSGCVQALIDAGAFVDAPDHVGRPPLAHAVWYDYPRAVAVLLRGGAGDIPVSLSLAVEKDKGRVVVELLKEEEVRVSGEEQCRELLHDSVAAGRLGMAAALLWEDAVAEDGALAAARKRFRAMW
eukprot:PLAT2082.1.p1 GENE.PLAT2082.1~~PLAT2082.1.p1  ORF type:complete len:230 (-),score=56.37 PLAT2082.1:100-789(-)